MTNEQKCPVCEKDLIIYDNRACCSICDYDMPLAFFKAIDKEKASAVQEERKRVIREVLAVANSVSMPYKSYLVIKDVLNNIKDEIG